MRLCEPRGRTAGGDYAVRVFVGVLFGKDHRDGLCVALVPSPLTGGKEQGCRAGRASPLRVTLCFAPFPEREEQGKGNRHP